jgi:malate dehydrogenase (oxaloacetate-decarboxylating)(NADP+)
MMRQANYFGPMMVECGDADAFIPGLTYNYPEVLRPALQCVGAQQMGAPSSGVYMMLVQDKLVFFTDATVIIDPNAEQLARLRSTPPTWPRQF